MKKDYAKTHHRYRKNHRTSPVWYVIFGLLAGAVIVGAAFWKMQGGTFPEIEAFKRKELKIEKAQKHQAQKTVSAPRFDFYTLLPQDEVEVPGDSKTEKQMTQQVVEEKPSPSLAKLAEKIQEKEKPGTRLWVNPNLSGGNKMHADRKALFYLQAGVFTRYAEADRLKARLGMMGQASTIRVQQQNGLKTYRVILGPYGNRTTASVRQLDLAKNQISSFVIGD